MEVADIVRTIIPKSIGLKFIGSFSGFTNLFKKFSLSDVQLALRSRSFQYLCEQSPEKGIARITKNPIGFLPVVHDNKRRAEGDALYPA